SEGVAHMSDPSEILILINQSSPEGYFCCNPSLFISQPVKAPLILVPCIPGYAKYQRPDASSKPQNNDEYIYDELKRLRKENAKLREERTLLKKVTVFFAKECH
ncbi:MAG: hypothetical protein ACR2PX_24950, partial [Endozoicomonas sp.]